MGRIVGYEYSYSFRMDDAIIPLYPFNLWVAGRDQSKITYLFDIRTRFKLKQNDGQIMTLGSERFGSAVLDDEEALVLLEFDTRFRMKVDYWMSDEEIRSWSKGALDFAKSDSESPVTAVIVGLDVWTVQQEGEAIEAAIDRAIKPESLIPIFLWGTSVPVGTMSIHMTAREVLFYGDRKFLLTYLPRIRVEDEAGLGLVCPVCSQSSVLGAQLSLLPTCNHACHPRCLFEWLNKGNSLCPSCSDPIPTDEQIYDDLEQLASSTPTLPRPTHTH